MKNTSIISIGLLAALASGCLIADYGISDTGPPDVELSEQRDRLFADNPELGDGADVCERWNSLDPSRRAVFLTLTHRLRLSTTPDGLSMLEHIDWLHLILGGGDSGDECGGPNNNRMFMTMDPYSWERTVESWDNLDSITDGGGSVWQRSRDVAGPHDPFTASIETDLGLRCALLVELPLSEPPTGQVHFFLEGHATSIERGSEISLVEDPHMLEMDLDFDCFHESNPLCPGADFEKRYVENYGDFGCNWVPQACAPIGDECYPDVELRV